MNKKRITLIFGTRPEAIKMAPVFHALKKSKILVPQVMITAQHREMLDQVLDLFDITPDIDLNLMTPNQTLEKLTASIIEKSCEALKNFPTDMVLVHGDTTTTFGSALAAFYLKIPVGHVEAGLRTRNIYSPFPEEVNRRLVTTVARMHFAPTEESKQNLLQENISPDWISVTGNTVIDALLMTAEKKPPLPIPIPENQKLVLITAHRRENFGEPLENICQAILELSEKFQDHYFVYPVHLNPNVRKTVFSILSHQKNVHLCEPQDYLGFVALMQKSHIILTDSGGLQEEAPALKKPVILLRNTSERPEAISAGTVEMVGTDKQAIIDSASKILTDNNLYQKMAESINPYGCGDASDRICKEIESYFLG